MRWQNSGSYDRVDQCATDAVMERNSAQMMGRLFFVYGRLSSE